MVLTGFALRLVLLDRFHFRADEALYSTWALHFLHEDPLFLQVWPDKPLLFIGALAATFAALGTSEASARFLNIAVGTLTIPSVAVIARRYWGQMAGLIAATALAFNPLAISYSPTAYTDPMLVLCGVLALLFACLASARPKAPAFWAGFWLACAIGVKQQGVFYGPLIVAVLCLGQVSDSGMRSQQTDAAVIRQRMLWALAGFAVIFLPLLLWDSLRWSVAPSPWDLGGRHYGGVHFVAMQVWPRRLHDMAQIVWYLTASWAAWALWALVILLAMLWQRNTERTGGANRWLVIVLAAWSVWFLGMHMITTMQMWDRYLLPLTPVFALLVGYTVTAAARRVLHRAGWLVGASYVVSMLVLLPPAFAAADGALPIGGDHGAYDGLTEAVAWFEQSASSDAVLYHQTLGWHLPFYLYGRTGAAGYGIRWFANPVALADDAHKIPHRRKFLIETAWAPVNGRYPHLRSRRVRLHERYRAANFTVYEVLVAYAPCDWCACTRRDIATFTLHPKRGSMSKGSAASMSE